MRTMNSAGIVAVGLTAMLVLPALAATSSTLSPAATTTAAGGAVEIGSVVDWKFSTPPMNSGGLTNLSDLRGRPLLIEFWGTR